jgi:hypothetical protein
MPHVCLSLAMLVLTAVGVTSRGHAVMTTLEDVKGDRRMVLIQWASKRHRKV